LKSYEEAINTNKFI